MDPILYLGDDDITRAAIYLSGVLAHFEIPFERIDSTQTPGPDFTAKKYSLYILSDYPRKQFQAGQLEHIADAVRQGAGLLMIGGWESFHGKDGEYHDSPLVDVLPVKMSDRDDRRNSFQPLVVRRVREHEALQGLPWGGSPPTIGGYNAITPKPGSTVVLDAVRLDVRITDDEGEVADCRIDGVCEIDGHQLVYRTALDLKSGETMLISEIEAVPLLVLGVFGQGKTAAFATDVAPHWVGGLVDWGNHRITQTVGDGFIEVGNHYAQFLRNLALFLAGAAG